MLDRAARRLVDPPLERLASLCVERRIGANTVTLMGFGFGLVAMLLAANQHYLPALILVGLNRIADGLDGAVARRTRPTDLGGYLDIVLDFIFYAGFVLAFAVADPARGVAAAFLIFSFVGTGTSFLAFAIFAAKRGIGMEGKGFHYLSGLTEGTETILLFIFVCLFPAAFVPAAWIFGALCWATTFGRIMTAVERLR